MPAGNLTITAIERSAASTGNDEIEAVRQAVQSGGTTSGNRADRQAALNRWWRMMKNLGYNMNSATDAMYNVVRFTSNDAYVDQAYAALESIMSSGAMVPEVTGAAAASPTETDWPHFHSTDGSGDGYSPDTGPSEGVLAWRFGKGHTGEAVPVISGRRVYVSGNGIDVVAQCVDEITGQVVWTGRKYDTSIYFDPGSRWTPAVTANRVLIHTAFDYPNGYLADRFSFDKTTGASLALPGNSGEVWTYVVDKTAVRLVDAASGNTISTYNAPGGAYIAGHARTATWVYVTTENGTIAALNHAGAQQWAKTPGGSLRGAAAEGVGRVYVGNSARQLRALNASTGNTLWTFTSPHVENKAYQYFSSAVEHDGRVYVGAASGYLYCLDATTGSLLWEQELSDWVRARPLVVGGEVYVGCLDGSLHRVHDAGAAASMVWTRQVSDFGFMVDLVGNANGILATGKDQVVYSVSPETGYVQWRLSMFSAAWDVDGQRCIGDLIAGEHQSVPTVVDGVVYISGSDGFVNALDADTGEELWKFELTGKMSGSLTVAEGKVFVGQWGGKGDPYYALDQDTGEVVWTKNYGAVWMGASYAGGNLYISTWQGTLRGVNPDNGNILWTASPGGNLYSHIPADDTKIYVGYYGGGYKAYDFNGNVQWTQAFSGNPDSGAPIVYGSKLICPSPPTVIQGRERSNGNVSWTWNAPADGATWLQNGTTAAAANRVFGSAFSAYLTLQCQAALVALDAGSGSGLWRYTTYGGGGGYTAPVVCDGKVIFGGRASAFVTCLDPATQNVLFRCKINAGTDESVPALYGNKVFLLARNGYLHAVH